MTTEDQDRASPMTGTPAQIEWAQRIRLQVNAEFERVASALEVAALRPAPDRIDAQAVIAILREKRDEVMRNGSAGYFIREWQELRDQVRRMIARDPRYQALKIRG